MPGSIFYPDGLDFDLQPSIALDYDCRSRHTTVPGAGDSARFPRGTCESCLLSTSPTLP